MTETPTAATDCLEIQRHGLSLRLPALWLRERCSDPQSLDRRSWQRLYEPARLPLDLRVLEYRDDAEQLHLVFSDGHRGTLAWAELDMELAEAGDSRTAWDGGLSSLPRYAYAGLDEAGVMLQALRDFRRLGFVILEDTPTAPGSILDIAARFGHVRDTNWGKVFDVQAKAGDAANDLAYTSLPLPPHTDNPYRNPVPGIQLLHALVNEAEGGLSTLVDGLAVARRLQAEDPAAWAVLTTTPVRFMFRDPGVAELQCWAPLLALDHLGRFQGIRYSSRLDYVPLLAPETLAEFYRARQKLAELLDDPDLEIRFRLDAGTLLMMDNQRLLHGRTAFQQGGARHLQGCYIDHDGPDSRLRVLAEMRG